MRVVRLAGMLLALLLAAAIAGCGGGGLDRAELAERASAICERYDRDARALGELDLADREASADYLRKAADLAEGQQAELEALDPSQDAQAVYDRLLDATGEARAVLAEVARDQPSRSELLDRIGPLAASIDAAATELGAAGCGDAPAR